MSSKCIDDLVAEWEKDPVRKAELERARERLREMGGAAALIGMMVPLKPIDRELQSITSKRFAEYWD